MAYEARNCESSNIKYQTKLIGFFGRVMPIILQRHNAPCPLIAICNVLLLKNEMDLGTDTWEVSQEKLLSLVEKRLIDSSNGVNLKESGYEDLLQRLATGIDVNLCFRRIDDFEFTPECAVFELLEIPLYHGWIVDPQDKDTANAFGGKSYNALMGELAALDSRKVGKGDIEEELELLKALKISEGEGYSGGENEAQVPLYQKTRADKGTLDLPHYQGELIRKFLKINESQLSVKGLFCLRAGLEERQPCVLFRNNYFSTMFKYDGELYLLVTSEGYIDHPEIVWEKLNAIDGNTVFVNGLFKEFELGINANATWDKYADLTSTSDYLSTIGNSASSVSNFSLDHEQHEFEEQPLRQYFLQPSTSGTSPMDHQDELEQQPQSQNLLPSSTPVTHQEFEQPPQGQNFLPLFTLVTQQEFEQPHSSTSGSQGLLTDPQEPSTNASPLSPKHDAKLKDM